MSDLATLRIALVHDVFVGADGAARLEQRLTEAREAGAELALLPELPLDRWVPARREPADGDAESPDGPRHDRLATAARKAGIGVVGGAIVRETPTGTRRNRALVYDGSGRLTVHYDKLHVPDEPGFWEAAHYEGGTEPPTVIEGFPLRLGLQICSDLFRPFGCQLLAALGAEAILAPRATPVVSYERWRAMICANAVSSAVYVLSTNRPRPEQGVLIGGPSLAVDPEGKVIAESTEPLCVVTLSSEAVRHARVEYPGYLPQRAELYARAWATIRSHQ